MDIDVLRKVNSSIHVKILKDKEDDDIAMIKGALSSENDRCPFKRNTRAGKRLADRWNLGRRIAWELSHRSEHTSPSA